jgi:hypothetical protein
MWHAWGKREMHRGFWWGSLKKGLLGRSRHSWKGTIKHLEERNRTGGHGLA